MTEATLSLWVIGNSRAELEEQAVDRGRDLFDSPVIVSMEIRETPAGFGAKVVVAEAPRHGLVA